MTAPYWQGDGITLYRGDCREMTEWLTADVLVTDPPYGRGWHQGTIGMAGRKGRRSHGTHYGHPPIQGDTDTTTRDAALALWGTRPAVVFGDPLITAPGRAVQALAYRKPPDAGARGARGGFRRDIELVYLTGPWPAGLGGRTALLETGARTVGNPTGVSARYGHPHAKPVDVMETLIAACPPGVVADPFAGSGSTLVAARNLGRSAIGIELDERYCERAARRLGQGALVIGDLT